MILDGRPDVMPSAALTVESLLAGQARPSMLVEIAEGQQLQEYWRLRREVFVSEQGLFDTDDHDDVDDDPRAVVLVARDSLGQLLGGVRLAPVDGAGHRLVEGWPAGRRAHLAVRGGRRPWSRRRAGTGRLR